MSEGNGVGVVEDDDVTRGVGHQIVKSFSRKIFSRWSGEDGGLWKGGDELRGAVGGAVVAAEYLEWYIALLVEDGTQGRRDERLVVFGADQNADQVVHCGLTESSVFFRASRASWAVGRHSKTWETRVMSKRIRGTGWMAASLAVQPLRTAHWREDTSARRPSHPPHHTILCGKPHIRICLHIPSKIPKHHKKPHHHPNLHRHTINLRPTQDDDWCNRFLC